MFRFAYPYLLFLLIPVTALFISAYFYQSKKRHALRIGTTASFSGNNSRFYYKVLIPEILIFLSALLLVFAIASVFYKKQKFYIYVTGVIFTMISILLLVFTNDLGAALLYFIVFLIIFYAGKSSTWLTLSALAAFFVAAYVGYRLFSHVQVRVDAWLDPWADPNNKGYQIIQGLISIVSGGPFGSGLGIGSPRYVPAYETDYIFTAINEEMGTIMGILLIGFYIIIAYEGIKIAFKQKNTFYSLISFGATGLLAVEAFIILGGILRIMPLTGITLPFVSYGGSSMLVSFMLAGIILSVGHKNFVDNIEEEEA